MAAESCHPRGLSWFARSCIPADPARHIAVPVPISAASATSNPAAASDAEEESPITALPDELLLECLARVPRASLSPLPAVCRRFAALLASKDFLHLRRAHGRLRPCLLAVSVSVSSSAHFARALLELGASSVPALDVAALPLPPPLPHCTGSSISSSSAFAHARTVALGRDVYHSPFSTSPASTTSPASATSPASPASATSPPLLDLAGLRIPPPRAAPSPASTCGAEQMHRRREGLQF
ncbi:unnamed protein product [Urochloa humidicola]